MSPSGLSISVVIPARNEADFIALAVRSVVEQDYPGPLECIVVDNGSTDETSARALATDGLSAIPILVVSEPTPGVGRAKNAGAQHAGGDVLIFLDADSRMKHDLVGSVAQSYEKGYPAGSIRVLSDGGSWVDTAFFKLMELGKRWFGIRAQMLYCERQLFLAVKGFDPELHLGEDVEFLTRVKRCVESNGSRKLCHVSSSEILTSPRRLRRHHHLGMLQMFSRWALALLRVGRRRPY